ncbi:MAG: DHA2 family efflux MFS transporter permease subunit [Deferribacterota bacterium]|nr:DHA2 family efflux MFS transporter permease subunit [Deferribacterota bacterium]
MADDVKNVNKWLITVSLMTGTLMSAIDTSIVDVALPYIQGAVAASTTEITWVIASYMLANVIVMPVVTLISKRFGRKNFYQFSVVLFTIASIGCGLSNTLLELTIWRIFQGFGGGAIIPLSQAILRETFPPKEHGKAMGIFGLGVITGPALGPLLGGWLIDSYSWHWIFFINLPIGIINTILVSKFIFDPPYFKREKVKIDYFGLLFLSIGLGALQIMLQKGSDENWFESAFIKRLCFIAVVGLILFIIQEFKTKEPAVNLRILKNVNLSVGTFLGGVLGMGLFSSIFVLPMFLQTQLDYPAWNSGLAIMPRAAAMVFTMPVAGRLYNRFGTKLIFVGTIISIISFLQFSLLNLYIDYWTIFIPQFLQGIGFGLIFVPVSTVSLLTISKDKMTDATGIYNLIRRLSGSVGTAIASTGISSAGMNHFRQIIVHNVNPYSFRYDNYLELVEQNLHADGSPAYLAYGKQAYKVLENTLNSQAYMLAYNRVYAGIALLFILSIPLLFLFRKNKIE